MKRYLNKEDKRNLLQVSALAGTIDMQLERLRIKDDQDKLYKKYLKTAHTYVIKAMDAMMEALTEDEQQKVLRAANQYDVWIFLKGEKRREIEENLRLANKVILESEDLQIIGDLATANCTLCESRGQEVEECEQRKKMLEYSINPLNQSADPGVCPYQICPQDSQVIR